MWLLAVVCSRSLRSGFCFFLVFFLFFSVNSILSASLKTYSKSQAESVPNLVRE